MPAEDANGNKILDGSTSDDSYTLMTLEQLGWNDGNGHLLTELNHAVKLAQATTGNYQLSFQDLTGWNELDNLLDSWFGQNNGGVVPAPVGTAGTYYTIPAGMIAFDIRAASATNPSYINIVVAVNPDQSASSIGVHGPMSNGLTTNFNLDNPNDYFNLPVSKYASDSKQFDDYKIKVSSYYTKSGTEFVQNKFTVTNGNTTEPGYYYAFLGGEVALVGYTFEVTTPGVYLLGSGSGPMTVAYFSVDGAAGAGGDGTGNLPLGYVDFVYDNGTEILSVTNRDPAEVHIVANENLDEYYYPSYQYLRLIPDANYTDKNTTDTLNGKIPEELVFVRRSIGKKDDTTKNSRYLIVKRADEDTTFKLVSSIYADNTTLTLSPKPTQ